MQDPARHARRLVVASLNRQREPMARRADDAGRPYLDIEPIWLPRLQLLYLVVRMIRAMGGRHGLVQLAMRSPQPAARYWLGVAGARKDDLAALGGEQAQ